MGRKTLKIVLACLTNLFGLLIVHAVIGSRYVYDDYGDDYLVERAVRAGDDWRSAQSAMISPGRVEGSHAYEHTMSPFGLRALISEYPYNTSLEPLWSWFGVESVLPAQCDPCEAEVFQLELDSERGVETVLRVGNGKAQYQYLVFKHVPTWVAPTGWQFLGLIDDIAFKYSPPPHFTADAGDKHWLVVQTRESVTAGSALYRNRVFEVAHGAVREVLSYPASGYQSGAETSAFDTLLLDAKTARAGDTLRVQYTGFYLRDGQREPSGQITVVFTRPQGFGRFVLDLRQTNISPVEFPSVLESDAATSEEFLRLNYEVLAQVAAGTNEAEREWLRGVVAKHFDEPRARSLARMLRR